jgi:hypothetical protein
MLNVLFIILWELESEIIGFSQESGDLAGPARHLKTSKSVFKRGELLLNTFVFFHIAEKVLSFSSLSPAFVFCLILLSFLEIAK